jgi:VanZ family protein
MQRIYRVLKRIYPSVYISATIIFVIVLFWAGSKPIAVGLFPFPFDKIAHVLAFSFLSLSLWFGGKERWPLFIIILASTIGALDEIHQIYLPGRHPAFLDFAFDSVSSWFTVAFLKEVGLGLSELG